MEAPELKRIIEALLFVSDGPLTIAQIREAVDVLDGELSQAIEELARDCEGSGRGIILKQLAGGYQFVTDPALAEYVRRYVQSKDKKKLSQASLETLSIIAYKQPLTRAEIEFIRGVNVDGALKTLLEKSLVRISGRKEVPGRPILYSSTKEFLDHFGLGSLKDLPKLAEFSEKDIELPEHLKLKEQNESAEDAAIIADPAAEPDAGSVVGSEEPRVTQGDNA